MSSHSQDVPDAGDLIPFESVPDELPKRRGKKRHKSSVYRWADEGVEGVRLRYLQVAGQKCTTRKWLMDFFSAITAKRAAKRPEKGPERSASRAGRTERVLRESKLEPKSKRSR